MDALIGNGSTSALNSSVVRVAEVNGTSTIVVNGTLPNGTTASGGTDSATSGAMILVENSGYWVMAAMVGCAVFMT